MIKTQHCPNCEATEQKLRDFRQEVSDAIVDYFGAHLVAEDGGDALARLVIPAPKPDPLVEVLRKVIGSDYWIDADNFRSTLADFGLTITKLEKE